MTKHYTSIIFPSSQLLFKKNILMANFIICFRYIYLKIHPSSGKGEWKSLDIKNIIAKVWNYKKDVLKLIFEAFYFVDNDTIETASINVMGILERIKLWIEGKMELDNNVNVFSKNSI